MITITVGREIFVIRNFSPIAQVAKIKHAVQIAIAPTCTCRLVAKIKHTKFFT